MVGESAVSSFSTVPSSSRYMVYDSPNHPASARPPPTPSVAASGTKAPSLTQQQWAARRNRELAVEELHVMVHRLVSPPCPLLLGSIVEPVDPRALRAPTRPASHVAELRADVWLDAWQRAAGKPEGKSKQDQEAALLTYFALARRWLDCPVLWVVCSAGQGGCFAGQADEVISFRVCRLGIRVGAARCQCAHVSCDTCVV